MRLEGIIRGTGRNWDIKSKWKEVKRMYRQTIEIAITRKNGVVTQIKTSSVLHPEIKFQRGNGVKWYQDKPLQAAQKA